MQPNFGSQPSDSLFGTAPIGSYNGSSLSGPSLYGQTQQSSNASNIGSQGGERDDTARVQQYVSQNTKVARSMVTYDARRPRPQSKRDPSAASFLRQCPDVCAEINTQSGYPPDHDLCFNDKSVMNTARSTANPGFLPITHGAITPDRKKKRWGSQRRYTESSNTAHPQWSRITAARELLTEAASMVKGDPGLLGDALAEMYDPETADPDTRKVYERFIKANHVNYGSPQPEQSDAQQTSGDEFDMLSDLEE